MVRHRTHAWVVALLALAALPALAQQTGASPTPATDAQTAARAALLQWRAQTATTLSSRTDANSLLTAALLGGSGSAGRMQLLERAAKAEPDAADIATLTLLSCGYTRQCDRIAHADRVHTLDPGNALAWMPQLYASELKHDASQVNQILQAMGQSSHFSTYSLAIAGRVEVALRNVPPSPDSSLQAVGPNAARAVQATAMTLARSNTPAFQVIMHACQPGTPQFAQRRADCRSIGLLLEKAETLQENRAGLALHRRAAVDDVDYAQALASGRRLDWQILQYRSTPRSTTVTGMAALVQAQRQKHNQAGAIQAMLSNAGVAQDPPADWVDKAQTARLASERRGVAASPDKTGATRPD